MGDGAIILKNSVEPQRHRGKTKRYTDMENHPLGEGRSICNALIMGFLCVSVTLW
jgi:hypothetical protein